MNPGCRRPIARRRYALRMELIDAPRRNIKTASSRLSVKDFASAVTA
jgi:hypothetical protein